MGLSRSAAQERGSPVPQRREDRLFALEGVTRIPVPGWPAEVAHRKRGLLRTSDPGGIPWPAPREGRAGRTTLHPGKISRTPRGERPFDPATGRAADAATID